MTRLLTVLLLLMLPLQWVAAATERYQPHPAVATAGVGADTGTPSPDGDSHRPGEHDCPQCHVLCLKGLFHFDLHFSPPARAFMAASEPASPLTPSPGNPERPPRLTA